MHSIKYYKYNFFFLTTKYVKYPQNTNAIPVTGSTTDLPATDGPAPPLTQTKLPEHFFGPCASVLKIVHCSLTLLIVNSLFKFLAVHGALDTGRV